MAQLPAEHVQKRTDNPKNRGARRALAVAGAAGGAAMLGSFGLGYVVAQVLTHPRRPGPYDDYTLSPFETGAPQEDVSFPSGNREHSLRGWWLPRPESDRVIICCHGYRGGKFELVGIGSALWRAGNNVLLFDFHGHRPSHGVRVSLGHGAIDDFMGAVEYAKSRVPNPRIGAIGFSMGASVVIIGAARSPDIRAVVADTPFSTHSDVVSHAVRRVLHIPGEPFARIADLFLPSMAGYRGRDVEPVREVAAIAPRPLLLIHGTEDSISPLQQGLDVYAAAGEPKELWIAEGAEHCGAYFQDRPLYCDRVTQFFEHALARENSQATTTAR